MATRSRGYRNKTHRQVDLESAFGKACVVAFAELVHPLRSNQTQYLFSRSQ
ncbi:MAG: hypothetical protein HC815_16820 [Richelia sp. RM1_1_1]|nr:hypothetical protein [Richelia sp. SM1_7_0]NJN09549.1 hypothetical protein [Richelia sp. RM1_1_1]